MSRVLVAEDDHNLGVMLEKGLRRHHLDVTLVATAAAAIDAAATDGYTLLILDLDGRGQTAGSSGGSDSLAVLRRLRQSGNPMPVIVLDGRGGPRDVASARAAGAAAYLPVPFRFADLIPLVEQLLDR